MSQQPGLLQIFLQHLPEIIKSLPALKSLFGRKRERKAQDETVAETTLSVLDLNETNEYIVGNIKTFQRRFKVIESPYDEANTCATITSSQGADITLWTEDEISVPLSTSRLEPFDVPLDKVLEQLAPGTTFWLESNVEMDLGKLIKQCPEQILPASHELRDSTTLALTNVSPSIIRDFEWPLPLQQLYPIYGFELQKGGKRVSNQLIQIRLGWIETLDSDELQNIEGYADDDSILKYFSSKQRKQAPRLSLSIRIDELKPREAVKITIFHECPPKRPLGFTGLGREG